MADQNLKDLKAVEHDGTALANIREQNSEICLEEVRQNGWALQYVKEQTPEICLEAERQNPEVFEYIKDKKKQEKIKKRRNLSKKFYESMKRSFLSFLWRKKYD